ncbi:MAG TPA: tetratricopeptide repeat protein [Burkholderiales bacterium]|nr:tetratricopeptide repeat protein [Burkholderiales bacterium]
MSLLLQALQKAAKSREDGDADPSSAGSLALADELALETEPPPAPRSAASAAESAPAATPAQAATVVQASSVPAFSPLDYAREHYMLTFIGGAFLAALAYGAYVYIQVNHPFRRSAPPASPVAAAPQAPVATAQPASPAAKISGLPGGAPLPAAPSAPAIAAAASQTTAAAAPLPAAMPDETAASGKPAPARDEAATRPAPRKSAPAPLKLARTPPAQTADAPPLIDASDSVETVVVPSSHARAAGEAGPKAEESKPSGDAKAADISVRRDAAGIVPVTPTLMQAYESLQRGDSARAKELYEQVLASDPRSVDTLLGLAAISINEGRLDEATRHYQKVLELDPRNTYAQAGLISIVGGADLQASESKLKQLISREPSAFLYFLLGNLYAEQSQWPAAQQAYYQAFQMQPDNPDYAFNLAIGLEHIGQPRFALDYYRKALDLSFKKGRANFDQSLVIQRVGQLSNRIEQ